MGSYGKDLLRKKATKLVEKLLYEHKMKEPIKKADMLKVVHKWCRRDFLEILRRAPEYMDLFFGLELKVKPKGNSYILVNNQDDTSEGSISNGWIFPLKKKKGFLMPLLGVIFFNGNHASEEAQEFLNMMGTYAGECHLLLGQPRKLITQDLVQEKLTGVPVGSQQ